MMMGEIFLLRSIKGHFMKMAFGSRLAETLAEALHWENAPAPQSVWIHSQFSGQKRRWPCFLISLSLGWLSTTRRGGCPVPILPPKSGSQSPRMHMASQVPPSNRCWDMGQPGWRFHCPGARGRWLRRRGSLSPSNQSQQRTCQKRAGGGWCCSPDQRSRWPAGSPCR